MKKFKAFKNLTSPKSSIQDRPLPPIPTDEPTSPIHSSQGMEVDKPPPLPPRPKLLSPNPHSRRYSAEILQRAQSSEELNSGSKLVSGSDSSRGLELPKPISRVTATTSGLTASSGSPYRGDSSSSAVSSATIGETIQRESSSSEMSRGTLPDSGRASYSTTTSDETVIKLKGKRTGIYLGPDRCLTGDRGTASQNMSISDVTKFSEQPLSGEPPLDWNHFNAVENRGYYGFPWKNDSSPSSNLPEAPSRPSETQMRGKRDNAGQQKRFIQQKSYRRHSSYHQDAMHAAHQLGIPLLPSVSNPPISHFDGSPQRGASHQPRDSHPRASRHFSAPPRQPSASHLFSSPSQPSASRYFSPTRPTNFPHPRGTEPLQSTVYEHETFSQQICSRQRSVSDQKNKSRQHDEPRQYCEPRQPGASRQHNNPPQQGHTRHRSASHICHPTDSHQQSPFLKHRHPPQSHAAGVFSPPRHRDVTNQPLDLSLPLYPSLTPASHQPKPPFHQPKPPFHQPMPPFCQPKPPFHQPTPSFHQPTASFHQPTASFHQPTASFHQPTASSHQPTPTLHQLTPPLHQPPPTFHQPTPSINQSTPPFHQSTTSCHQPTTPFYQPPPPFHHSSASHHGSRASHHVPSASQELSYQDAKNPGMLHQPCIHTDRSGSPQWQPVMRDSNISTDTTYRATPATVISSSTPSPETISSVDTSSDVLPGLAVDTSSTSEEICRPSAVFSLVQSYREASISRPSQADSPQLQGETMRLDQEAKGSTQRQNAGPMASGFISTRPRVDAKNSGAGDPPLGSTEQGLGASMMMHGADRSKVESMLETVGGTKLNTYLRGPTESGEGSPKNVEPGFASLLLSVQPIASVKSGPGAGRATAPEVCGTVGSPSKTGSAKTGTSVRAEQSVRPKVKARVAEIELKIKKSTKVPAKFDDGKLDSKRPGTGLPPDDHPLRGPTMLDMLGTDTKLAGISSILNDEAFSIFENPPAPPTISVLSTAHVALHDRIMESRDKNKKFLLLSHPKASGNNDRSYLPSRRLPTGKENFEPIDDGCSVISLPEPDAISRYYLFEFGKCIRKLVRNKRPMPTQFELFIPTVGDVADPDILVLDDATRNSKLSLELEQIIDQLRLGQLGECFATSDRTHADNPEVIYRARKRCDDILDHHTNRTVLEFFFTKSDKFEEDVKAIRFLSLLYEWSLLQLPESDVEKITLRYQYETTILSHSPTAEMNFKNVIDLVHDCRAVDCQQFSQRAIKWKMESLLGEMTLKMPPPDAQQKCRRLLFFSTLLDGIAVLNAFVRLKRFNWDD